MKVRFFFTFTFICLIIFINCRQDLDYSQAKNKLQLSKDTIFFDTLLANQKSQIFTLKIKNTENKDIEIPSISLFNKTNSFFKINVNGKEGPELKNIPLRKKDSLYVFIEILSKSILNNVSYSDEILVQTSLGFQKVFLKSFLENTTNFITPTNKTELGINVNTTWNNTTAYYIEKTLRIINNATLQIEPGTKIYFAKNSELVISDGSKLIVNGTLANKVTFRTNVQTNPIESYHDQWNAIKFEKGSSGEIKNAIIKGGKNGLNIIDASVVLENIQIYNQTFNGIVASNSKVSGKNIVINNCGDSALKIERGGEYEFYHSTFFNYSNFSNSDALALYVSNKGLVNSEADNKPLTKCIFGNCIFTGISRNSIYIDENFDSTKAFNYFFENNLIKYQNQPQDIYNNNKFILSMLNQEPSFINQKIEFINLRLKPGSFAIGKGIKKYSDLVDKNLDGLIRIHPASLGAY